MKNHDGTSAVGDVVEPASVWVEHFAAASLPSADVADLVAGALKASQPGGYACGRSAHLVDSGHVCRGHAAFGAA